MLSIDGFTFHSSPRSLSYTSNNPALVALQGQEHGGVGMYIADNVACDIIKGPQVNLECLVFNCLTDDILVAIIYRPPSYPMTLFNEHLAKLIDWLDPKAKTIAVMGDFNDDIFKSSSISKLLSDKGYVQLVTEATTERGTLIDHVYVKSTDYVVDAIIRPTYFSDHEGIVCCYRRAE